jgi:toxin YoeB
MLRRLPRLIEETRRTPFDGAGKPEALRRNLSGCWSRRIDDEHRLVYGVTDDELIIIQARYHYGD